MKKVIRQWKDIPDTENKLMPTLNEVKINL